MEMAKKLKIWLTGGFFVNVDFTPARLYELAKMDGAIILSQDLKKILQTITEADISTENLVMK